MRRSAPVRGPAAIATNGESLSGWVARAQATFRARTDVAAATSRDTLRTHIAGTVVRDCALDKVFADLRFAPEALSPAAASRPRVVKEAAAAFPSYLVRPACTSADTCPSSAWIVAARGQVRHLPAANREVQMPFTSAAGKSEAKCSCHLGRVEPPSQVGITSKKDNTEKTFSHASRYHHVRKCRKTDLGFGVAGSSVDPSSFPIEGEPEAQGKRQPSTTMHSQACAMASASLATSSLASRPPHRPAETTMVNYYSTPK